MHVAIDCFAKYGYAATSIDRIARAAGVTKGALYYHFKDKEDLLLAAVENRIGQFERRVVTDLTPVADAPQTLRNVARICQDHATKSNHRRMIVTLMVEALDTNPRIEEQFRDMMRRFRTFLSSIVRAGQESGVFRGQVVPDVAAEVFAGAIMGAEIQYYQDPKHFDLSGTIEAFLEQHLGWLSGPVPDGPKTTRRANRRVKNV